MGIYDREYYRREGPSFLESFTGHGKVCKWLILINVAVFVLQLLTKPRGYIQIGGDLFPNLDPGAFTRFLVLDPGAVLHGQIWRLLTYAFLHEASGGLPLHILFNMLFLWWFGTDVEDLYGPREFLAFYLVSAVVGGVAFVLGALMGVNSGVCLGASGAVMAVMLLYAFHYPTRIIYLFFFLPVPIWLFALFYVAQDVFGLLGGSQGVAFIVHLGGAAFAAVYYKLHWRLMDYWPNFRNWQRRRSRPSLRVYREEEETPVPVAAAPASSADVDEQLEAKLDAVLEKVARHGQGSLTDTERQILMRMSEIYKRRRS